MTPVTLAKLVACPSLFLVITRRLSTIRNADEILVFRQGCIIECGSFEQLAHGDGLVAQLVAAQ